MTAVPPMVALGTMRAAASAAWQVLRALPGRRDAALAVVNGAFGDVLAEQASPLAIPMTLRAAGSVLPLDPEGLAAHLPTATGRICVFVHGLMSTESIWSFSGDAHTTYGSLLARDRRVTAVYARYNTGQHISTNGRDLAVVLHQLMRAWPVRIEELSLVGHSMGGLVVRSACHYGRAQRVRGSLPPRRPWSSKVRRVVLLGTPNTGASLEVVTNLVSRALWSVPMPVTRMVGLGLDRRSAGIKDLRWGFVVDQDWQERDPDSGQRPRLHPVSSPPRARHLTVAGSLTADADHPVSRMLGDALVSAASARGAIAGNNTAALLPRSSVHLVPGVSHIALANRPEVYEAIVRWW